MKQRLKNTVKHPLKMLIALFVLLANFSYAQQGPPSAEVTNKLQGIYKIIQKPEVTFETFLQSNRHVYESNPNSKIQSINDLTLTTSCSKVRAFCSNGDFENGSFNNGLDTTQWLGAYGTWGPSSDPNPASLTDGFLFGPLNSAAARHTIVTTGTDPITGISLPAPNGGSKALRLGNSAVSNGAELIAKTITVTSAQTIFDFMYAVVFEDPNHAPAEQPSFTVRVFDCATGAELSNVCNLGNNTNRVTSDAQNPFFQNTGGGSIAYRNWTQAQINLSAHIGKTVTIFFTNKDCSLGGHYGYTYLDNFCLSGPIVDCPPNQPCPGAIALDTARTDTCGTGQICVKYRLPRAGTQTGSITIDLDIYQNGVNTKLQTITSPVLSQDSSYCFNINPAALSVNNSTSGFDYVITGRFNIGATILAPVIVGNPPNGQRAGQNNDYRISCDSTNGGGNNGGGNTGGGGDSAVQQCCPGTNLIANPGFNLGNSGFTSGYIYQPVIAPSSVLPGYFTVTNTSGAATVSSTWNVGCSNLGNHLLVNGNTGLTGRAQIWRQTVNLDYGKKYKFCMAVRNLPQPGFDVKPRVTVKFEGLINGMLAVDSVIKVIDIPAGGCVGETIEREINLLSLSGGSTAVSITLYLDETGKGDGNDMAVDNISLVEMKPVLSQELLFNLSFNNTGGSTFGITADPIAPLTIGCVSNWEVAEVDANYAVLPATQLMNPPVWMNKDPNMFNGYVGTSTIGDTLQAGMFQNNKRYRIIYSRRCACSFNSLAAIIDPVGSGGNLQNIKIITSAGNNQYKTSYSSVQNNTSVSQSANSSAAELESLKKELNVYPNPAKSNVTVSFGKAGENSKLVIYSTTGSVIREISLKQGNTKLDVNTSALPAGTYFIKFYTNNKIAGSKAFIKQ